MHNGTFSLSRTDSGASMKSSGGPRIATVFSVLVISTLVWIVVL
jgi:hypothetical protein